MNISSNLIYISSKTSLKHKDILLCTYPIIPSFVDVCIYFEWFSPVAIFRTGFSFVEYSSGSFLAFLQSDN